MPIRSAVIVSKDDVSVSMAKAEHLFNFSAQVFKALSDKTVSYSFEGTDAIGSSVDRPSEDLIQFLNSRDAKSLLSSSWFSVAASNSSRETDKSTSFLSVTSSTFLSRS